MVLPRSSVPMILIRHLGLFSWYVKTLVGSQVGCHQLRSFWPLASDRNLKSGRIVRSDCKVN